LPLGNWKPADAEQELTRILPNDYHDPIWARVQYQLGRLYFNQGAYVKAKNAFEVCAFFVDDVELRNNISRWIAAIRDRLGERGDWIA
jgi:hypothetical protein